MTKNKENVSKGSNATSPKCSSLAIFYGVRCNIFMKILLSVLYPSAPFGLQGIVVNRVGVRGRKSPVNALTSVSFLGPFSNLAKTFISPRSWTTATLGFLPRQIWVY